MTWIEIVLLSPKQYAKENKTKIDSAKNSMNSKRIVYNWEHLKNL